MQVGLRRFPKGCVRLRDSANKRGKETTHHKSNSWSLPGSPSHASPSRGNCRALCNPRRSVLERWVPQAACKVEETDASQTNPADECRERSAGAKRCESCLQ